jgi:hypothetical protein
MREVTTSSGGHRMRPSGQDILPGAIRQFALANHHRCDVFPQELERLLLRAGSMLLPVGMFQNVAQVLMILVKRD